ncbi:hypothetical protein DVH24_010496 [Malus domestica]|uniref:ABC-2 type transporter domain-containing protein n=1 Tax=Malus domestica TaxID=3750 RepID=A0A498JYC0_MALDO|nr:hypothetical protein DVH24_010496 [Malus domestica]
MEIKILVELSRREKEENIKPDADIDIYMKLSIMAMITMTLFLRTEMHHDSVADGVVYTGALFFSLVAVMFNGMADLSMTVTRLPVFYKQRNLLFFPPWAYAIPTWILKIPITCVEVAVWVFTTYYVIGYDPNVGRLFKQFFLLFLINQMASGMFRFIAGVGRTMTIANTIGSFALLVLFALGGFVLSREDIKKWWIWGYWTSPLMYGQNAIVVNEFLGKSWRHVLPNSTEPLGVAVLKSRGFFTEPYWYWIGAGVLAGYMLIFNIFFTLALTYLKPIGKPQAVELEDLTSTPQISRGNTSNIRRIPVWWRWYYWACPMAWTLYGLATSQFGDIQDKLETGETVEEFMRQYFGFKQEFIGVVAAVVVGFTLLFALIFALSIKKLSFQRR